MQGRVSSIECGIVASSWQKQRGPGSGQALASDELLEKPNEQFKRIQTLLLSTLHASDTASRSFRTLRKDFEYS